MSTVITRIPPSPTGHLHIGTARTALFNFLFAQHHKGKMIFRSEDTDQTRSKREYEEEIIKGLTWLGFHWDNEIIFRQSERGDIYKRYLEQLLSEDKAYLSKEESKREPGATVEVVRLRNANKVITFNDLIRGDVTFDTTELGDFVIARSIDDALYHFTVVVDDFDMGVTHVLRGEDHISNTPRQILIQEAIGAPRPEYAHMPLILAPDRSKLSKRHGTVALDEYINDGFLPAGLINYLALLGWNPGTNEEFFTLSELIDRFDLSGAQKGGAIFDRVKLLSINKHHLDKLSDAEFELAASPYLPTDWLSDAEAVARFHRFIPTLRERIQVYREISHAADEGEYNWLITAPIVDLELLKWKKDASVDLVKPRLEKAQEMLAGADFSTAETIKNTLWEYAEEVGKGELLWPLRVSLTGLERSPDPFSCAYILGKEETLQRLKSACDKINS